MRIVLEENPKRRGGDIFALANLTLRLEKINAGSFDVHDKKLLGLWLKYLHAIETEALSSNYEQREMASEFNLPFEEDYAKQPS